MSAAAMIENITINDDMTNIRVFIHECGCTHFGYVSLHIVAQVNDCRLFRLVRVL